MPNNRLGLGDSADAWEAVLNKAHRPGTSKRHINRISLTTLLTKVRGFRIKGLHHQLFVSLTRGLGSSAFKRSELMTARACREPTILFVSYIDCYCLSVLVVVDTA